jgi:hypothetical protein
VIVAYGTECFHMRRYYRDMPIRISNPGCIEFVVRVEFVVHVEIVL